MQVRDKFDQTVIEQKFTNKAFDDDTPSSEPTKKNNGFLNKRPDNQENDLHRAIDEMAQDINGECQPEKKENIESVNTVSVINVVPESLKGRQLKDLTSSELALCEEIGASDERFRHRFNKEDYKDDFIRSGLPSTPAIAWME